MTGPLADAGHDTGHPGGAGGAGAVVTSDARRGTGARPPETLVSDERGRTAGRPGDAPPLWTVGDLCRFLGVSKRWVHERTRRDEIPCYRLGALLRFNPEEVQTWAAKFHHSAEDTSELRRPR